MKLKTYYNNPLITQCVDKYGARQYLQEKKLDHLLQQLLAGPYTDPEALCETWDKLPEQFVVKCNHGSGYNILVKEKSSADLTEVVGKLSKWMKQDYWKLFCELQYKYIPKKIIVEEYLGDKIQTYKFYCFHGKPEALYVIQDGPNGEEDHYNDYFDMDWNWIPVTERNFLHRDKVEKPDNLDEMIEIAKALSKDFPFVRVDLYNIDGKIYFSELTFIPFGGYIQLNPPTILEEWGKLLHEDSD